MKTQSIGITKIGKITIKELKEIKDVLLIEEKGGKPISALVPYEHYLEMQSLILKADILLGNIIIEEENRVS